jgi:DNA polymerase-1
MSPTNNRKKVSHKLGDVVRRELGVQLDKEHQGSDWGGPLSPDMLLYAAEDSRILLHLVDALGPKVREADLHKVADIECRALPAITWMANAGVPFDSVGWRRCLYHKEVSLGRLKDTLDELAPDAPGDKRWNWNSPKQIIEAFRLLGVKLSDTKGETLSRCEQPLAKVLLKYRKTSKLVGTYGPNLLKFVEDGRIYGSWWQNGAGTGRMACSKPNLQNLPPEVRRYVKAPAGRVLVVADYSQIELRIAAKISREERMLAAFANGEDIHTITARSLTGREEITKQERKLAKAVNFGLLYGMSSGGLSNYARASYGVEMSREDAERYWREYFETYPGLKAWHDREYRQLKKHGSTETRTLTGRRRTGVTKLTERLNSPVQGTGADGIKLALALLYERRGECPGATPILAVHDEIVVEVDVRDQAKDVEGWLEKAMVDGMDEILNSGLDTDHPERVPVKVEVEVVNSWSEG